MNTHRATIRWTHDGTDFLKRRYSRVHSVDFGHGIEVVGSAATSVVPKPFAIDEAVDPEAMLTASLSACHMLTFLAAACKKKFMLDEYVDQAVGHMEKNADGKLAITRVELHPALKFSGDNQPTEKDVEEMHHFAHENCFIANSVKTEVTVVQ